MFLLLSSDYHVTTMLLLSLRIYVITKQGGNRRAFYSVREVGLLEESVQSQAKEKSVGGMLRIASWLIHRSCNPAIEGGGSEFVAMVTGTGLGGCGSLRAPDVDSNHANHVGV